METSARTQGRDGSSIEALSDPNPTVSTEQPDHSLLAVTSGQPSALPDVSSDTKPLSKEQNSASEQKEVQPTIQESYRGVYAIFELIHESYSTGLQCTTWGSAKGDPEAQSYLGLVSSVERDADSQDAKPLFAARLAQLSENVEDPVNKARLNLQQRSAYKAVIARASGSAEFSSSKWQVCHSEWNDPDWDIQQI